jgi:hypothetical protein
MPFPAIAAALVPLLGTVIDRVVPDKAEAARVKGEIEQQAAEVEASIQLAILDLAKEDAKTGKGGFRWGAGWLCIISLGWTWVVHPVLTWVLALAAPEVTPPPNVLETELAYGMLVGMLGLAGVRSYDLKNGSRK